MINELFLQFDINNLLRGVGGNTMKNTMFSCAANTHLKCREEPPHAVLQASLHHDSSRAQKLFFRPCTERNCSTKT